MPTHLDPQHNGPKPSSRFSALNVFKFKPGSTDAAPPPPPKDSAYASSPSPSLSPPSAFYAKSLFSRSATSLVPSLSPESASRPVTPYSSYPSFPVEFGKRPNAMLGGANGRAAAPSPVPSAGGSLRSFGRTGGDYLTAPSMDGSTDSSGSCPNANANLDMYLLKSANSSTHTMAHTTAGTKPKKSGFKLASLAKRNRSKKDLSDAASTSASVSRSTSVSEQDVSSAKSEGDEGISMPWNFQHNIHVDEGYIGLPPSWSTALLQVGFNEDEIAAIHARRRAAVTGLVRDTNPTNPQTTRPTEGPVSTVTLPTTPTPSPTVLLEPAPRSTSLRKGRDALTLHPSSMYSVATTLSGGPPSAIAGTSPAPSPRTPSFSMKSLVSGIKNSLTNDSAGMQGASGSSGAGGATGEESEQYVLVDGDNPDEGKDQEMGDETFIEPYPYDASSVSSHQTHTSRVRQTSQSQQTPRIPTFPQIQLQRTRSDTGHVSVTSSTSRAPSPLAHSSSLPIPTPPRGYTHDYSSPPPSQPLVSAGPPPGPTSPPLRTPPRRVYHVVNASNASSDSYDATNYVEPPPAYVSPEKGEWVPKNEKEEPAGPPPPSRPIPPVPAEEVVGETSGLSNHDGREGDQEVSVPDTTGSSADDIPRTADEVLDISSYYSDNSAHGEDAEQARVLSPTPPLVIDKRMSKLAMLPPRISFHQESSLEDWSESLFNVIGTEGKRSSILMGSKGGDMASVKKDRRTTLRPISPPSVIGGDASATASNSTSLETVAPSLPDISFGVDLTLGPHARGTIDVVQEGDEQEQAEEGAPEDDTEEQAVDIDTRTIAGEEMREAKEPLVTSSAPILSDVSLGTNVSSIGKGLEPSASTPSAPSESPRTGSVDGPQPSPPPKAKPRPTPIAVPPAATLAPPKMNVITGISGKSPVNSLFGFKPQPLPIPIPPSQIRAQLRPAPPKPPNPSPILPLPPLKRLPSHPNLQPSSPAQSRFLSIPSSPKVIKHEATASHASPSDSCPDSSQTLVPARANSGDRDSGLSTITVTPATIATAKTEVVRTAVASVIDSDAVSLASRRESVVSTADPEPQALAYDVPDLGEESPRMQEREEAPDDSMVSETSSVSLLRDGPQSKWPAPPPTPVELGTDSTPRRVSRFRTTSLGRVTHLQAMGGAATSPISSHCSRGSSDTTSSSTCESAPLTTPNGVNGVAPSALPKAKGGLAAEARLLSSTTDTFGGIDVECEIAEENLRPSKTPLWESHASISPFTHPLLAQLQPYIIPRNPLPCFTNLVEIAEGESGSVFAARVAPSFAEAQSQAKQENGTERPIPPGMSHVAIKRIPLPPLASSPSLSDDSPVSNKLASILHELSVLKDLDHEHLLLLDAVYISSSSADTESADTVDTSLWIRMELMERSLADVIGLVADGLALQERLIARFASDILRALDYLQRQHIAHRDVRSDNLLVNASGVVKLADFSNAIRVDRNAPIVNGAVGVIYWQAPEMRAGPYNALKVDIWSLGATVWELAETVPPFSTPASPSTQMSFAIQASRHIGPQWPLLTHPEHYSRPFHEFLRLCGRESAGRPSPGELLNTSFIRNACGRAVILQLLSQCRAIEEVIAAKEASAGSS